MTVKASSDYFKYLDIAHVDIYRENTKTYWQTLLNRLQHGSLLYSGKCEKMDRIDLIHTTEPESLKSILSGGCLITSPGCLVSSVYCVPARRIFSNKLMPHNYYNSVFKHKNDMKKLEPVLISIKTPTVSPLNYLMLGDFYYHLLSDMYNNVHYVAGYDFEKFIKQVYDLYQSQKGLDISQAKNILDYTVLLSSEHLILSFVLFEATALCLMLSSSDIETTKCFQRGELNCSLYVNLMHKMYPRFNRFNPANFPKYFHKLKSVIERSDWCKIDNIDTLIVSIANQVINILGSQVFVTQFSHIGHDLYMHTILDPTARHPLYTYASQIITDYWKSRNIDVVYNGLISKGEFGITAAYHTNKVRFCSLEKDSTNLLSVGQNITLTIVNPHDIK